MKGQDTVANQSGAMEADTISKNGRSLKSHTSRRNKCSLVVFVCLLLFSSFSAYAQEAKPRIAVLELSATGGSLDGARELTSILTTELVNTNKFRVAERSRIEQIINELGLQSTQDVNVRAAEIGKLLGVHKIITGEYAANTTNIRIINVESGDIEKAVTIYDKKLSQQKRAKKLIKELLK